MDKNRLAKDIDEIHLEVLERLKNNKQKYTKSRKKLVDAMTQTTSPLTLPEIVALNPDLASSSTYRNLDVLVENNVIVKIVSEKHNHFELAEPFKHHHHHLICISCGDVTDVDLDVETETAIDANLHQKAKQKKFSIVRHTLDLHGYCQQCA